MHILFKPLRIECGQKLKMVDKETGLIGPDRLTPLYRMKHADEKKVICHFHIYTKRQLFSADCYARTI